MLWIFLQIPQRTTLHQPTVNFEVKSVLFQLCYRSNTNCIFRLRGGSNCARSEVANNERSFISQKCGCGWKQLLITYNLNGKYFKRTYQTKRKMFNWNEMYCCVSNILRVSFTQYNYCRYRIY